MSAFRGKADGVDGSRSRHLGAKVRCRLMRRTARRECLLLAISGLFRAVRRRSALPLKADIQNPMSAVALISSALTPEPDIRGGHRPPSNSRSAAAIIALPSASRSSALSSVSSSRAGGLLLAMEAYTQKFSENFQRNGANSHEDRVKGCDLVSVFVWRYRYCERFASGGRFRTNCYPQCYPPAAAA